MTESQVQPFLRRIQQEGLVQLEKYLTESQEGWIITGMGVGALAGLVLNGFVYSVSPLDPLWLAISLFLVSIVVCVGGLGWAGYRGGLKLGQWATDRRRKHLANLRQDVNRKLTDGGLLLSVLQQDELRLPSVRPAATMNVGKDKSLRLVNQLENLVANFDAVCIEAGLRSGPPAPLRKLGWLLGFGGIGVYIWYALIFKTNSLIGIVVLLAALSAVSSVAKLLQGKRQQQELVKMVTKLELADLLLPKPSGSLAP
jgi:hypothetical protein